MEGKAIHSLPSFPQIRHCTVSETIASQNIRYKRKPRDGWFSFNGFRIVCTNAFLKQKNLDSATQYNMKTHVVTKDISDV